MVGAEPVKRIEADDRHEQFASLDFIFVHCGARQCHRALQRDPGQRRDLGDGLALGHRLLHEPADLAVLVGPGVEHAPFDQHVARRGAAAVVQHDVEMDRRGIVGDHRPCRPELDLDPGPQPGRYDPVGSRRSWRGRERTRGRRRGLRHARRGGRCRPRRDKLVDARAAGVGRPGGAALAPEEQRRANRDEQQGEQPRQPSIHRCPRLEGLPAAGPAGRRSPAARRASPMTRQPAARGSAAAPADRAPAARPSPIATARTKPPVECAQPEARHPMVEPRAGRAVVVLVVLAGAGSFRRVTVPGNEKSRNSPGPMESGAGAGAGVLTGRAGVSCAASGAAARPASASATPDSHIVTRPLLRIDCMFLRISSRHLARCAPNGR